MLKSKYFPSKRRPAKNTQVNWRKLKKKQLRKPIDKVKEYKLNAKLVSPRIKWSYH